MTTPVDNPDITKREIGERVKLNLHFDKETTKALGDGEFEAIITTSAVDRYNESIATEGIDTDTYMEKNAVVLYGHDYFGLPIGKATKLVKMKNKIKATFKLAVDEFDFAATVASMIKGGYLNAVSIGGIVREWSDDYKTILKMEMVEFSVVSIPANSEAMITARSFEQATGKTLETIEKEYKDFAAGNVLDKFKHMGDDELIDAVKVLENLIARLKESAAPIASEDVKRVRRIVMQDAKAVATQSQRVIKTIKTNL